MIMSVMIENAMKCNEKRDNISCPDRNCLSQGIIPYYCYRYCYCYRQRIRE